MRGTTTVTGKVLRGAARKGNRGVVAWAPPCRRGDRVVSKRLTRHALITLTWALGTIRTWSAPEGRVGAVERRLWVGAPPFSDGR